MSESGTEGKKAGMAIKSKTELLQSIAEHRLLTVTQIAALHYGSRQAARRRLRQLEGEGLVSSSERHFGPGQGRPEGVYTLSRKAASLLKENAPVLEYVAEESIAPRKVEHAEHQVLLNWIHIHFRKLTTVAPDLTGVFFSASSPYAGTSNSCPRLSERVMMGECKEEELIPDGMAILTSVQRRKSLLFFIEADRGSEALASKQACTTNLHGKIARYRNYLGSAKYKQHEKIAGAALHGFRLLFVAASNERFSDICELARAVSPSSFVWVTSQDRLFAAGLGGSIWARGGRDDRAAESILGPDLRCDFPVLPVK